MTLFNDTALVLEGGGMRGVFTCGVLDYFIDHEIRFPYVIGVSAGACNGLSYMSWQRGRAKFSNIDMLERYHYIGLRHLLTKRNIMDFDLLFEKFPEEILPYDYEACFRNPALFEMVTTNCLTGKAMYLSEQKDKTRLVNIARASSSLPFVCPIVRVDGLPMLDGGIVDSIPFQRAIDQGYKKIIVVLTRNYGYRKKIRHTRVPPFIYSHFPFLREAVNHRSLLYNQQLDVLERLESEGRVKVIRPVRPVEVDRIERNTQKLLDLYNEGYNLVSSFKLFP